jgi:hypothetical protein
MLEVSLDDCQLNSATEYSESEQFFSLLVKLNTLFGEFVKQRINAVLYIQWQPDNWVAISTFAVASSYDLDTVFSIGYYGKTNQIHQNRS